MRQLFNKCFLAALFFVSFAAGAAAGEDSTIRVLEPNALPAEIACERVAIGKPGDYKPWIAKLPSGDLVITAFHQHRLPGGKIREEIFLFRSKDGGRTWSEVEVPEILGREPAISVTAKGTMLVTAHVLIEEIRNKPNVPHAYIHRSTDGGKTWTSREITWRDVKGAKPNDHAFTTRNVAQFADGMLAFGVSAANLRDEIWHSTDDGKTWTAHRADFKGPKPPMGAPFMGDGETYYWVALGGDLLGVFRVNPSEFEAIPGTERPEETGDQVARLILFRSKDRGKTWTREPEIGSSYCEMYPSILNLADGRLLMNYTLRANDPKLGLRAAVGEPTADGFKFDFARDKIVLDEKTPQGASSGGGFGPSVQLADGTLVSSYSYRGPDGLTHVEVVRWKLPAKAKDAAP